MSGDNRYSLADCTYMWHSIDIEGCGMASALHVTLSPLNQIMDYSNTAIWTIQNFVCGDFLPISLRKSQ